LIRPFVVVLPLVVRPGRHVFDEIVAERERRGSILPAFSSLRSAVPDIRQTTTLIPHFGDFLDSHPVPPPLK